MKRVKKIWITAIVFSMLLSIQSMAINVSAEDIMSEQMQLEVEELVQERLDDVGDQFEGMSPGYLEVYTEYLTAYYEQLVLDQYGITPFYASRYYIPNGGVAKYTTVDAAGDHFDVVILMLNKEDSYDYLLNNWNPGSYDVGDIFVGALGYDPGPGTTFGAKFDIIDGATAAFTNSEWESIQAADGYVLVETVQAREYPDGPVSFLRGWDTHPYYVPYSSLPSDIIITVQGL